MVQVTSRTNTIHATLFPRREFFRQYPLICLLACLASTGTATVVAKSGSNRFQISAGRVARRLIRSETGVAGAQGASQVNTASEGLVAALLFDGERAAGLPHLLHQPSKFEEVFGGTMFLTLVFENLDYMLLSRHWDLVDKIKTDTSAALGDESHKALREVRVGIFKTRDQITARYLITVPENQSAIALHDALKSDTRITTKMQDVIDAIPNIRRTKEEPLMLVKKSLSAPFDLSGVRVCNGDPATFDAGRGHRGCSTYSEGKCNHRRCQTDIDVWGRAAESVCTECRACTMAFGVKEFVYEKSEHPHPPCADYVAWKDSTDFSCQAYVAAQWCSRSNLDNYGPSWLGDWGIFSRWAVNGIAADTACCSCGGGVTTLGAMTSAEQLGF